MTMAGKRVMIAATKSGSGKTMISCALMKALKNRGLVVVPYKCGPDYIDPMYHRTALDMGAQVMDDDGNIAPGGNLDTFFTDKDKTIKLLYEGGYDESDIAVIEGVMGLYDGLGGTSLTGSSYELATVLKTPIILICDAKGMGRSILAQIKGFLDYDERGLIKGIILNRISGMYYAKLKQMIEAELDVSVVGYVPEDDRLHMGSRHLGLMTPTDTDIYMTSVSQTIKAACEVITESIDIDSMIEIAGTAERLDGSAHAAAVVKPLSAESTAAQADTSRSAVDATHTCTLFGDKKILKMAVAMDEAFCFYY
ncbi:MAG: cobyrinic acid a,c-diamide synthase, partial [Lachnospiraceae bacterium]|nr:cobyrinic acid a,c-diamide synthase [Lachnospiraceae bacterium]